jgi:molecular chaperone GrpE
MHDETNQNDQELQPDQEDITLEPIGGSKHKPEQTGDEEFIAEDGEGNTGSQKDIVKDLREKLKRAIAEKQEYMDGWQRTKADFVNARKRDEEARKEQVKFATEDLVGQLTSVLDSFTMAFSNKDAWEKVDKNWRMGVEYIYSQFKSVLEQNGFSEFNPVGEKFDPMKHHAIETVEVTDPAQAHTVVEVIQKGYSLNGKIIRPASVKIGEVKS